MSEGNQKTEQEQQQKEKEEEKIEIEPKQDETEEKKKDKKEKSKSRDGKRKHKKKSKHKKHRSRSKSSKKKKKKKKKSKRHRKYSSSTSSSSSSSVSSSYERRRQRRKRREQKRKRREKTTSSEYRKRKEQKEQQVFQQKLEIQGQGDQPKKYWDGYQWIIKTNSVSNLDPSYWSQTQKMRRVQLQNVPTYLNLTEQDFQLIALQFMQKNYCIDNGNNNPVISCEINNSNGTAIIEVSSVEEANRLVRQGKITIFDQVCPIIKGTEAITNTAQTSSVQASAQAQAAALTAINMLSSTENNSNFQLSTTTEASNIIKIQNTIRYDAMVTITDEEVTVIKEDIELELQKFGTIKESIIIYPYQSAIGARAGTLFVAFDNKNSAIQAVAALKGRKFDDNELQFAYISESVYEKHFKHLGDHNEEKRLQYIEDQKLVIQQLEKQKRWMEKQSKN